MQDFRDFIVGIDLGGTSSKVALLTGTGALIAKWQITTDTKDQGRHIIPNLIAGIQAEILAQGLNPAHLKGIGMGSPGQINREKGEVTGAYNLGWRDRQPVRRQFQAAFGDVPFVLENDANAAAVGEQTQGAGEAAANMVLVTLGTGIGGGIIVDGQLVIGEGAAGEIGHMVANPDGVRCSCGHVGCLETIASVTGIVAVAKEMAQISAADSTLLADIQAGERFSTYDLFQAAEAGDQFANQVIDETMRYLSIALSQIATILHPQYILIGGGLANAGAFLLDKISRQFTRYGYPGIVNTTEIKLATLGNDAGVLGAAALIMNQLAKN